MNETNYRIRYRKGDFEVDVQGDKDWVEKKFKELTEREVVAPEPTSTEIDLPSISLVEFVKAKGNPSGHTDLTMIFSYWLHHRKNMGSYNINDIQGCYSKARISSPSNPTDIMNKNQGKGYLMPSQKKDGKKAWVITRSGEEHVEQMK